MRWVLALVALLLGCNDPLTPEERHPPPDRLGTLLRVESSATSNWVSGELATTRIETTAGVYFADGYAGGDVGAEVTRQYELRGVNRFGDGHAFYNCRICIGRRCYDESGGAVCRR